MKTIQKIILVLAITMIAVAGINAQTTKCTSETSDAFSVPDRTVDSYTYAWTIVEDGSGDDYSAWVSSGAASPSAVIDWSSGTPGETYTITLTESMAATAGGFCTGTGTFQVIIGEAAVATLVTDQVVCEGDGLPNAVVATLTTGDDTDWSFEWSNDGGGTWSTETNYSGTFEIEAATTAMSATTTYQIRNVTSATSCGTNATVVESVVTVPTFASPITISDD